MATAIELALYGRRGTHGVTEFTLTPGEVRLRLKPWEGPGYTDAVFGEARLTSIECYPGDHDTLDPPWDVIGFDSNDSGDGRWRFVLHCDAIEWCFESSWPVVALTDG